MKNTHFLLIAPELTAKAFFPDWRIARIDGRGATTLPTFYEQIARVLDFPDYFGANLDSLDELLNDLQWLDESRILLYIEHSGEWLSREKSDDKLTTLLDLLEATAEDWKWLDEDDEGDLKKKEFKILIQDSTRMRTLLEEQEIPFGFITSE